MNELQIFKNDEFGQVRVLEKEGDPWFVGNDIATILGYADPRSTVVKKVDSEDKGVAKLETPGGMQEMTIVNESGLYSLILSSTLPNAKQFKRWVTSDVLPTIRKHGMYATDELLNNPDLIISIVTKLKEERQARLKAEQQVAYKTEVIKGVTEDIDIYTKRNVLNKVVRYKGSDFKKRWNELYDRFREVYSTDLKGRCEGYNLKQTKKKDRLSIIKYAEKFGYLDNLYKIALKLYETDINEILESLKEIQ